MFVQRSLWPWEIILERKTTNWLRKRPWWKRIALMYERKESRDWSRLLHSRLCPLGRTASVHVTASLPQPVALTLAQQEVGTREEKEMAPSTFQGWTYQQKAWFPFTLHAEITFSPWEVLCTALPRTSQFWSQIVESDAIFPFDPASLHCGFRPPSLKYFLNFSASGKKEKKKMEPFLECSQRPSRE